MLGTIVCHQFWGSVWVQLAVTNQAEEDFKKSPCKILMVRFMWGSGVFSFSFLFLFDPVTFLPEGVVLMS